MFKANSEFLFIIKENDMNGDLAKNLLETDKEDLQEIKK